MPISRDPRMDRRRRVLMDGGQDELTEGGYTRKTSPIEPVLSQDREGNSQRRSPGYSQDVRKACSQRLVQLIPVRRRSYLATILVSLLLPGLLVLAHYMINVSGSLHWWGHPLAIALDASNRNSIAAWLSSQLWLLCLGATVLTFQLRRHKLDDYNGDYRLWFWLVLTCLAGSIDATTRISDLFGLALDRWCQLNLGWSGPAVVQATMAVMIGMLGLRLCTELKSVPTSLVFWLVGLVCWAGSAALAREELLLNISVQVRIWLKITLWLGGLTAVWLSALTYLRRVYIEAQHRFLLRGRLASSLAMPLGQRIRQSIPSMPKLGQLRFRKDDGAEGDRLNEDASIRRSWRMPFQRRATAAVGAVGAVDNSVSARRPKPNTQESQREAQSTEQNVAPSVRSKTKTEAIQSERPARGLGTFLRRPSTTEKREDAAPSEAGIRKPSMFGGWLRKAKNSDEAHEYRKVLNDDQHPDTAEDRKEVASVRRRWIPKLGLPKIPKLTVPKLTVPKIRVPKLSRSKDPSQARPEIARANTKTLSSEEPKPKSGGFFSKFKLPSLRLPPPNSLDQDLDNSNARGTSPGSNQIRSVGSSQALPGTSSNEPYDDDASRPLSKAERKRLRREQQDRAA